MEKLGLIGLAGEGRETVEVIFHRGAIVFTGPRSHANFKCRQMSPGDQF